MNPYDQIIEKSKEINWNDIDILHSLNINFPVPKTHARYAIVSNYTLSLAQLSNYHFTEDLLVLCDESVRPLLSQSTLDLPGIVFLNPTENSLKILGKAEGFITSLDHQYKKIIVIGGGVIANFGGYIAERLGADLVYVPTTIIAMSDACIGGKVRVNDIQGGKYIKHAYKSFYEPSEIILDPRFLDTFDNEHIRVGLAEVIKHAVYQSPALAEYMLSDEFDPFTDKQSLLRVILWTADLKRICLEVDPEESKDGSYRILRAAHDISDKLEERSEFTLPHGQAVEKAMVEDLHGDMEKKEILFRIYQKLGIGYTTIF